METTRVSPHGLKSAGNWSKQKKVTFENFGHGRTFFWQQKQSCPLYNADICLQTSNLSSFSERAFLHSFTIFHGSSSDFSRLRNLVFSPYLERLGLHRVLPVLLPPALQGGVAPRRMERTLRRSWKSARRMPKLRVHTWRGKVLRYFTGAWVILHRF